LKTGLFFLLVILTLVSTLPNTIITSNGQSAADGSGSELIQAFQAVQKADALGAPPGQVDPLSLQLNTALQYYNTALELQSQGNSSRSNYYSGLSNSTSIIVTAQAITLQSEAETNQTNQKLAAYATAALASVLSAFLVLESHRVPNFLRKRKLYRAKIRTRGSS